MSTARPPARPLSPWRAAEIAYTRHRAVQRYNRDFGRIPDLASPRTYNERMLHRLVYDRDPRLTTLSDKVAAKDYVADKVGNAYNVPLLGQWRDPAEIDWSTLPDRFALKPSGDSGRFVLVRSPADRNIENLTAIARNWLSARRTGRRHAEWGYRGVPRRIIAEPLLTGPDGNTPPEINVYTFGGKAALIRRFTGRKTLPERRDAWFDPTGRQIEMGVVSIRSARMELSDALRAELIDVAEALSAGLEHLRVDFYLTGGGLRVGELTPYSWGGHCKWRRPEFDASVGDLWGGATDYSVFADFAEPDLIASPPTDPHSWLRAWEKLINAGDFETARQLFAPEIVAFGSLAETMTGLDALEQEQWRKIWRSTRGFAFDTPMHVTMGPETTTLALRWRSEGRTEDNGWYERRGRCTLVLERRNAGLVCTHSHFSMDPGVPPRRSD